MASGLTYTIVCLIGRSLRNGILPIRPTLRAGVSGPLRISGASRRPRPDGIGQVHLKDIPAPGGA